MTNSCKVSEYISDLNRILCYNCIDCKKGCFYVFGFSETRGIGLEQRK